MHTNPETLGDIIKYYREKSDFTVEELANKLGISERYLYKIENEGKKPSYDVLYNIIRTLSISPERIFYPEINSDSIEVYKIAHILINSNAKEINRIIKILDIITSL